MIYNIVNIRKKLKEKIIGQDKFIDILTLVCLKQILRSKSSLTSIHNFNSNLLVIGKSGVGKTFTIRETLNLLNMPFIEINAKGISQEGWAGTSFIQDIENGLRNCLSKPCADNYTVSTHYLTVVIDEFDKVCMPNYGSNGNYSMQVQASLLKYVEGFVSSTGIDTTGFLFIFSGAFSDLYRNKFNEIGFDKTTKNTLLEEDSIEFLLLEYGILSDLLGRIFNICQLNDLTRDEYKKLIFNKNFISNQWLSSLRELGLEIPCINYAKILTDAENKNCGVRGLIASFEQEIFSIIENNLDKF